MLRRMAFDIQTAPAHAPDGALIQPDRACYQIIAPTPDGPRPMGVAWQTIERKDRDGRAVLEVVVHQRVMGGRFDMRDLFVLDAATLRPLSLTNTRHGETHVELAYADDRISGEKHEETGVTPVDVPLTGPVWEGNLYGVTIAALPLEPGRTYTVPTYQYDKGLGSFTVSRTGEETVETPDGARPALVVEMSAGPGSTLTYLIDAQTRRELGYRSARGSQMLGGDCSELM
jgi:hypothetical protein